MSQLGACLEQLAWSKHQERYPLVCGAIASLSAAVEEEVNTQFWRPKPDRCRKRKRGTVDPSPATDGQDPATGGQGPAQPRRKRLVPEGRRITALRCQLWRKNKKLEQLEQEIAKYKRPKDLAGRVSEEWIIRVILTAPNVSARALSESFRMAVGEDHNVISRTQVGRIRAAFLELWKDMVYSSVRSFIEDQYQPLAAVCRPLVAASRSATGGPPVFLSIQLTHVQDEAEIRLLSSDPSCRLGLPRRSRTSKVQMHVVKLSVIGRCWDLPQELEALSDKTAATLATSFEQLLLTLLSNVVPTASATGGPTVSATGGSTHFQRRPDIWLVHCIIGDAIPTNLAAAKILWALALQGNERV